MTNLQERLKKSRQITLSFALTGLPFNITVERPTTLDIESGKFTGTVVIDPEDRTTKKAYTVGWAVENGIMSGDKSDTTPLRYMVMDYKNFLSRCVVGWEATEQLLFGDGDTKPLPFDGEAFVEYISEYRHCYLNVCQLVMDSYIQYIDKQTDEKKL